jgi:hypothetical protein
MKTFNEFLNEAKSDMDLDNAKPGAKITNISKLKTGEYYYANLEGEWLPYELSAVSYAPAEKQNVWFWTAWMDGDWVYVSQAELLKNEVEEEIKNGNIKKIKFA